MTNTRDTREAVERDRDEAKSRLETMTADWVSADTERMNLRRERDAAIDRAEAAERERDEARKNFGKALEAGAKAEAERDAAEVAALVEAARREGAASESEAIAQFFTEGAKVRRTPPDLGGIGNEIEADKWDDLAASIGARGKAGDA